jgi:hypothetical protein
MPFILKENFHGFKLGPFIHTNVKTVYQEAGYKPFLEHQTEFISQSFHFD